MGLRAKFNLAIVAALLIGYAGAGLLLRQLFVNEARQAVLANARVMMTEADSVQAYVVSDVLPVTGVEQNGRLLTASVPFYAAKTAFRTLHNAFPDYSLAEAALNPTNPEDRATDWQADFINGFRNNPTLTEETGIRSTPTGQELVLANPIAVSGSSCLACHSTPAAAPTSMVAQYGPDNGYDWKLHEIIGAQIVSVPMALPLAQADTNFVAFMAVLGGMFVLVLAVLNLLLHFIVVVPVVKVSKIANAVSMGEANIEEYETPGNDEIASLSKSFNRMRRSLDSAMRMLNAT